MAFLELLIFPLCLLVSWALTKWRVSLAQKVNLLAYPNERSSHSQATPTSGGWSFVITTIIYLCYLVGIQHELASLAGLILLFGTLIAVVGYIDDRRHVPAMVRLSMHLICVFLLLLAIPQIPEIEFFGAVELHDSVRFVLLLIAGVWLINLFNFMDGIDGIAGVETITALSSAAFIVWLNGGSVWVGPMIIMMFSVAGFLICNWPPAKIFMGDVGSGFLGFILVAFVFVTAAEGVISIWSWSILLGAFVADASVTLIRRALRNEKVYEAHRSHAYQILSRRWASHQKVTLMVLGVNMVWLLPLAWCATYWHSYGWLVAVLAYLPLVVAVYRVGAGTTND